MKLESQLHAFPNVCRIKICSASRFRVYYYMHEDAMKFLPSSQGKQCAQSLIVYEGMNDSEGFATS